MAVQRGIPPAVHLAIALTVVVGAAFVLWWCQNVPTVEVTLEETPTALGPHAVVRLHAVATRGGVSWVEVSLVQGETETKITRQEFETASREQTLEVEISGGALALQEGPATLLVRAADGFFRPFGASDDPAIRVPVTLDFTPPRISVAASTRYPKQGGAGVAIIDSDEAVTLELRVGESSYPSFATSDTERRHVGLYALPWDLTRDASIQAVAHDAAGNESVVEVPASIRRKQFESGKVTLRRDFLVRKIPELLPGRVVETSQEIADAFVELNRDLRAQAAQVKRDLSTHTTGRLLWQGAFVQPRNTRVFSNFAESRDYTFDGRAIDSQVHLGFDLASVRQAPVPAANSGVVVFAAPLNIYGNAVIIDHGLGLQTLYAHLSSIQVSVDDTVGKEQVIGRTGTTGLAVGDHLHYEVLVHGVPVSPLEWWDGAWVRDYIEGPLADAGVITATAR